MNHNRVATGDLHTFPAVTVDISDVAAVASVTTGEQPIAAAFPGYRIAAIVPCHNEALAITKVVKDLKAAVSGMEVYVYDNCSTDDTAEVARRAGAIVRSETRKGKGNAVRRAFADVDADIYLLIDGDDTYDAAAAPELIRTLIAGPFDHVLGVRKAMSEDVYREGHERGNQLLNQVVANLFGSDPRDMLSGYRVFSRRFVKTFPASSREFEIETELTIHSLSLRVPSTAIEVGFRERAEGTESKLRTYHDGFKILNLIVNLVRHERPVAFYGAVCSLFALVGAMGLLATLVGLPGNSPVASALVAFGGVLAAVGLILDGTRKTRHESSRLAYLTHRAIQVDPDLLLQSVRADAVAEAADTANRQRVELDRIDAQLDAAPALAGAVA